MSNRGTDSDGNDVDARFVAMDPSVGTVRIYLYDPMTVRLVDDVDRTTCRIKTGATSYEDAEFSGTEILPDLNWPGVGHGADTLVNLLDEDDHVKAIVLVHLERVAGLTPLVQFSVLAVLDDTGKNILSSTGPGKCVTDDVIPTGYLSFSLPFGQTCE